MHNEDNKLPSSNKPLILMVFSIIFIISNIILYYNSPKYSAVIKDLMYRHNLISKKELFTELFFKKYPQILSSEVVRGRVVDFSFTVHNLEGKDIKYLYKVYFESLSGEKKLIDQNVVNINNGDSKTIASSYVFTSNKDFGLIRVILPEINQNISFYLPTNDQ